MPAARAQPDTRITRIRAAAEEQTRRLRRNREPEGAFTEIAAQEEIVWEQHERAHAPGSLKASVRAVLATSAAGKSGTAATARCGIMTTRYYG